MQVETEKQIHPRRNHKSFYRVLFKSYLTIVLISSSFFLVLLGSLLYFRQQLEQQVRIQIPLKNSAMEIKEGVYQSMAAIEGWMSLPDEKFIALREKAWKKTIHPNVTLMKSLMQQHDDMPEKFDFDSFEKSLNQLYLCEWWLEQVTHTPGQVKTDHVFSNKITNSFERIYALISMIIDEEHAQGKYKSNDNFLVFANFRGLISKNNINNLRYLQNKMNSDRINYIRNIDLLRDYINKMTGFSDNLSLRQKDLLQLLAQEFDIYVQNCMVMFDLRLHKDWDLSQELFVERIIPLSESLQIEVSNLVNYFRDTLSATNEKISKNSHSLVVLIIAEIFILIILSVYFAKTSSNKFVDPVNKLINATHEISQGHFDKINIGGINEFEQLANEFVKMNQAIEKSVQEIKNQAEAIDQHAIVSIADIDGNIIYANDKFCEISQYQREELIGKNHRIIKSGEHSKEFWQEMWNTISNGHVWQGLVKNKAKDGSIYWVDSTIVPFMDSNNNISKYVAIRRDITNQKQLEEEMKETVEKALQAEKSKSEFLANMSHEIRTPMNSILGFSELLLEMEMAEEQKDYVETIDRSANSLLVLLNDILDFSKIEAGKLELESLPFDLKTIANDVCDMIKPKLQGDVELQFYYDENLPDRLQGDSARLRQVLVNLLGNAAKFTEQGEIKLSIENLRMDQNEAIVKFSVSDTGIGICKSQKDNIFEEFSQADGSTTRKYGGTGLGLAISRRIVGLMNGQLDLESELGQGSVFYFCVRLPLVDDSTLPNNVETISSSEHWNQDSDQEISLDILVAEDNKVNQKLIEKMLTKLGHNVEIANDGFAVIDKMNSDHHYDLIFMDMQMPNMNGLEATQVIRLQGNQRIPIIALTANAFESDREECFSAGMNDFVAKPIKANEIKRVIHKWSRDKIQPS